MDLVDVARWTLILGIPSAIGYTVGLYHGFKQKGQHEKKPWWVSED